MLLKWYGTATIIMEENEESILFDPFVAMRQQPQGYTHHDATGINHILITHGHFDHLVDVPELVRDTEKVVYCSQVAAETLQAQGVSSKNIRTITPGDTFQIGPFNVGVWRGEHIKFDGKLIATTLFNRRLIKHRENMKKIARLNRSFPQGEVLVFEVEAQGKKVLHLGSLNLEDGTTYPDRVDLLTIPFQGRSDINDYALKFVERLQPEAVYLHHFDDTFPPVSREVNYQRFLSQMEKKFPGVKIIIPDYRETTEI